MGSNPDPWPRWILMLIGVAGTICVSYVKSETHGSDMAETRLVIGFWAYKALGLPIT